MPRIDLAGRAILITGASSGIGRAAAIACARAGMNVALVARRADQLEDAAREAGTFGRKALAILCDVTDPEQCEHAVARASDEFAGLHAVFANAGYSIERPALDDDGALRRILEVNFFGTLHILRPAMKIFRAQNAGHAIICSSCLSKITLPYYSAYTASKAMQEHVARALRLELRAENVRGIHVSSVHPIGTRTELWDRLREHTGRDTLADLGGDRFLQPASRVADAVVQGLRSPRGEIWTSALARFGFSLAAACPGLAERVIARRVRKRLRRADGASNRPDAP